MEQDWRDEDCRNCEHWLYRHKLDTKNASLATHLCLRGGMFAVPSARRSDLYMMMARDIRGNVPFFLCEKKADIFLFYLDIDYAGSAVVDPDTVFRIALRLQEAIRACYRTYSPADWLRRGTATVLICDEPTPVIVQKRPFVKTGIHLVFPNLFVTEDQANSLALYCIQFMMTHWPQQPDALPWASVIDTAVYGNGKGLRMLGSRKCVRCPQCSRRVAGNALGEGRCGSCNGLGYSLLGQGRPYTPVWVILGGESSPAASTERFRNSPDYALMLSTILCDETRPCAAFALPEDFVSLERRNLTSLKRLLNNEVSPSDPRVASLQTLIRSLGVPQWANITISRVTCNEGKSEKSISFLCKALYAGSRFCLNKMQEHKSSTIYFTISRRGVLQRCFSKKPPAPGCKGCASYSSRLFPITDPAIHMLLFPMLKAVGAELDLEYGNIFGSSWGTEGESDSRITILRRKRILNRLSTVIPPPIKKQRPVPVPDDDASDASDDLDAFDSDV